MAIGHVCRHRVIANSRCCMTAAKNGLLSVTKLERLNAKNATTREGGGVLDRYRLLANTFERHVELDFMHGFRKIAHVDTEIAQGQHRAALEACAVIAPGVFTFAH